MTSLLVDDRDQLFVLHEMLNMKSLFDANIFSEFSEKEINMVVKEAHKLAVSELMPVSQEGDRIGCTYDPETHQVTSPQCYVKPLEKLIEGEWLVMCDDPEVGGQGFPLCVGTAVSEIFYAGCFAVNDCLMLTHGIGKLVELYGTDAQKEIYMQKLYSGKWGGTMCLTEPQAGSDVGTLEASAKKNTDGTYAITGSKIFITRGESDLTENIIHAVLARIEGDPPGTKGISIFIVPKFRVNDDGSLGKHNDVVCSGIEHKMGIHGIITASINFGDKGGCIGYLLGEEQKGMKIMFNMMNEARLFVGLQALSMSSKAFLHAVDYTKNRVQGTPPDKKKSSKGSFAIINHPDVKRMLLWMKVYVEGCRALTYFVSFCFDQIRAADNDKDKSQYNGLIELLTPIVKAYNSNMVWEITATAIQCAGGYGFCSELPFEQIARDCKGTSIYEGTNGIQAVDLIFRKLIINQFVNFNHFISLIDKTVIDAKKIEKIKTYAEIVEQAKTGLAEIVNIFTDMTNAGKTINIYYHATPFLEAFGDVTLGWMHLWQLTIAHRKLAHITGDTTGDEKKKTGLNNKEAAFYQGKILGARYYIGSLLKRVFGKFEQLKSEEDAACDMEEKFFTT
jgi:alkylation response protein AidB-like acyl-CoA dehydrogenase